MDKIGRCLEAAFSKSLKSHEVIVVDEHSTDQTVEK
ncbi:MAG: glycosyltransferase family A protein [Euryarchaeota archaeon]|nr:glycosyltransferase family A protein [Euryarchaeota archaeon]